MKKSSSPRWLDRAILISPVYFILCTTPKGYRSACKHLKLSKRSRGKFLTSPYASATTHFFELPSEGKSSAVVCIRAGDFSDHQINALLVHEAIHIWQRIRDILGEKSPGHESEAYAVQNISQCLMQEYDRQRSAPS